MYENAGFIRVREEPRDAVGHDPVSQTREMRL